ncbi:integrin alpha-PS3-like [Hyposmocoma kahamanoa]|uniref:integrin alpha-PS3-like n=1 Tax=Hyposmocoma kahamanoa TaxID=1477025 RepID=UPI000E6D965E|nr:integrin alpha-PS3-like [Hyposmocoma kahamanoa]
MPFDADDLKRESFEGGESVDFWLGATVRVGSDFVLACAPRYTHKSGDPLKTSGGTFGRCFMLNLKNESTEFVKVSSVTFEEKRKYANLLYHAGKDDNISIEEEMDSFGWSVHIADEGKVIVGGPAMANGRAMFYKTLDNPALIKITLKDSQFNFGYSITSGRFKADNNAIYAISSPYGTDGIGVVMFFDSKGKPIRNFKSIKHNKVGALFGAALCSAKLEATRDALLVGAPVSTVDRSGSYDVGAVYVYTFRIQNESSISKILEASERRVLKGYKNGGYFGSAIASVGDLTGDNFDEIAIAAPYENEGRGVVYLYSGGELLKELTEVPWLQRLEGDTPDEYFGLSLSPLQDYDENGCNELAIGSPGNNRVTLLRCMASVAIEIEAEIPDLTAQTQEVLTKNTSFMFKTCLKVIRSEKPNIIESTILVNVTLNHPHVRMRNESVDTAIYTFDVNLRTRPSEDKYCNNIFVSVPSEGDYDKPIEFHISAKLLQDPFNRTTFNPRLVVLDKKKSRSQVNVSKMFNYASALNYTVFTSLSQDYLIGSTDKETVNITVTNNGNTAYKPSLRVHLSGVGVYEKSSTCQAPDGHMMVCSLPDVIKRGGNWTVDITLNVTMLTTDSKSITLEVELFNHGVKVSNSTYMIINLRHDSIIKLTGSESNFSIDKEQFIKSGKSNIQHDYAIINLGSNRQNLICVVTLQPDTITLVSIGDQECIIMVDTAECIITWLRKNEQIIVNVVIDVPPKSPLINKIVDGKSNITTSLSLYYDNTKKSVSLTTSVTLISIAVPTWIIIVAVLVALLVIVVLAWALHECGCLRRKNKEELKKLKQDIKRQTTRRSIRLRESMIEVIANQQATDDQKPLVGLSDDKKTASCEELDLRLNLSVNEINEEIAKLEAEKNCNETNASNDQLTKPGDAKNRKDVKRLLGPKVIF